MSYGMEIYNNKGSQVVNTSDKLYVFHSKATVALSKGVYNYGAVLPNIPEAIFFYQSPIPIMESRAFLPQGETVPRDVHGGSSATITWYAFVPISPKNPSFGMVLQDANGNQTFNTESKLLKILGVHIATQDPTSNAGSGNYRGGYYPAAFSEQTPFSGNLAFSSSLSKSYAISYMSGGSAYTGPITTTSFSARGITVNSAGVFSSDKVYYAYAMGMHPASSGGSSFGLSTVIIDVSGL